MTKVNSRFQVNLGTIEGVVSYSQSAVPDHNSRAKWRSERVAF